MLCLFGKCCDVLYFQGDKLSGTKPSFREWFPERLDKVDFKLRVSDIVSIFSVSIFSVGLEAKSDANAAAPDDLDKKTAL